MRVVIAHNFYRSENPSGENRTVTEIADQLEAADVEVVRFNRFSDDISSFSLLGKAAVVTAPIHSFRTQRELAHLLDSFDPDILQIHNVYPLLSPSVIRVAQSRRIPVVSFVHNYRMFCLAATMMRDGLNCCVCLDRDSRIPAVRYGCYRGSRTQSAVMAVSRAIHDRTWGLVDRYVAVSKFVGDRLEDMGIAPDRIVVRPNTVPDPGLPPSLPAGASFLFVGRLEEEKGVRLLLEAWQAARVGGCRLDIAGSGPLAQFVSDAARNSDNIQYLGHLESEAVSQAYGNASVVVVPSTWHEPFGRTAIEAFSRGRPVLATKVGGLDEIVDENVGWRAAPTVSSLSAQIELIAADLSVVPIKGNAARRRYEQLYVPERSTDILLRLYEEVRARNRSQLAPS
jgi:glycosyltransferase involved in cell wall biosynthesis